MALPLILNPADLLAHLDDPDLLIIDLSSPENYAAGHVPGAIHVPAQGLMLSQPPVPNKLPTAAQLSAYFSAIGLTANKHVVVYDDQQGPWAGRMIWTLDIIGHHKASVLNGQLKAWKAAKGPIETTANAPTPSNFAASIDRSLVADLDSIRGHLGDGSQVIWDTRTPAEYCGEKIVNAAKGGHIPGAINWEWTQTLISAEDSRLKDLDYLHGQLQNLGITPDKQVVTHCQTHRRSGHTYLVLKALGYSNIQCYDGSWFEWGNHPRTPVETS